MDWITLKELDQLRTIDQVSQNMPVVVFKHSTRCMISGVVLNRLERAMKGLADSGHPIYFLDLLRYRNISDAIEHRYGIDHASPQVLVIRNGSCVFSSTHLAIDHHELIEQLNDLSGSIGSNPDHDLRTT